MDWARMLAYITGTVDQELLLRNEYLVAENRILKTQIKGRLLLSDAEEKTLADIGHRLGRKALEDVAMAAKPDMVLGWYRRLVARKLDDSKSRQARGRHRVDNEVEALVVRMARLAFPRSLPLFHSRQGCEVLSVLSADHRVRERQDRLTANA